MLLGVHQRGICKSTLNSIKDEDIEPFKKVVLKKVKGLLSDFLIGAFIQDTLIGYVSEVPFKLMTDCEVLTDEIYNFLPSTFIGTIVNSKIDTESKSNKCLLSVYIDDKIFEK